MPPNAPLLVSVPILLLAAGVSAWALYERNPMSDDRPNPLSEAASKVGVAWSAAGGIVSALVSFGLLTSVQGDAVTAAGAAAEGTVTAVGTVLAGVLPLIAGVVASFRTASAGREHVTPVASPRDHEGRPLVAAPLIREGGQTRVVGDGDGIGEHRAE